MSVNNNQPPSAPIGPNGDGGAPQIQKAQTSVMKVALPIFLTLAAIAITVGVLIVTGPLALPFYVALIAFAVAGVSLLTLTGIGIYAHHTNRAAAQAQLMTPPPGPVIPPPASPHAPQSPNGLIAPPTDPSVASTLSPAQRITPAPVNPNSNQPSPANNGDADIKLNDSNARIQIQDYLKAVRALSRLLDKGSLTQILKKINLINDLKQKIKKDRNISGYLQGIQFIDNWTKFAEAHKAFSKPLAELKQAFDGENANGIAKCSAEILKIAQEFPVDLLSPTHKQYINRLILEAEKLSQSYNALSTNYQELAEILENGTQVQLATHTASMLTLVKEFPMMLLPETQAIKMQEQIVYLTKLRYPALYHALISYAKESKSKEEEEDFIVIINDLVLNVEINSEILQDTKTLNDNNNVLEILKKLHKELQESCKSLIILKDLPEALFKSDSSEKKKNEQLIKSDAPKVQELALEVDHKSDAAAPLPFSASVSVKPLTPPSTSPIVLEVDGRIVNGAAASASVAAPSVPTAPNAPSFDGLDQAFATKEAFAKLAAFKSVDDLINQSNLANFNTFINNLVAAIKEIDVTYLSVDEKIVFTQKSKWVKDTAESINQVNELKKQITKIGPLINSLNSFNSSKQFKAACTQLEAETAKALSINKKISEQLKKYFAAELSYLMKEFSALQTKFISEKTKIGLRLCQTERAEAQRKALSADSDTDEDDNLSDYSFGSDNSDESNASVGSAAAPSPSNSPPPTTLNNGGKKSPDGVLQQVIRGQSSTMAGFKAHAARVTSKPISLERSGTWATTQEFENQNK